MATKKTSKSDKEAYSRYKAESRWSVNRKKKINRHLKKFPNDTVAAKALGSISYRRRIPTTKLWKGQKKADAQLLALFKVTTSIATPKQKRFSNTLKDSLV